MRPGMAQLVPPILTNNFVLVDLVDTPEVAVSFLIQVDGLEDVLVKGNLRWKLTLVICAIKAHFKF